MGIGGGLLFFLFIAIAGIAIFVSHLSDKKRIEALSNTAAQLGLSFSKLGRDSTLVGHQHLDLFSRGRRRGVKNEIWGQYKNLNLSVFGYKYTVGRGKNSNTCNQTVASISYPYKGLSSFQLKPENIFHKIGQVFGYKDIDFDLHPGFSKKYLLRGEDEIGVRNLFSSDVMTFFTSRHGLCVELAKDKLIVYRSSKRCSPENISVVLDDIEQLHRLLVKTS